VDLSADLASFRDLCRAFSANQFPPRFNELLNERSPRSDAPVQLTHAERRFAGIL
jgi:hypothetical protein